MKSIKLLLDLFGLLAGIYLIILGLRYWHNKRYSTGMTISCGILALIWAFASIFRDTLLRKSDTIFYTQFEHCRSMITGSLLTLCIIYMIAAYRKRLRNKIRDTEQALAPYGAQRDADKPIE